MEHLMYTIELAFYASFVYAIYSAVKGIFQSKKEKEDDR